MTLRALALVASLGLLGLIGSLPLTSPTPPRTGVPELSKAGGFIGSAGCRSCHPGEYDSWHQTYHRTMTRSADAVFDSAAPPSLPADLFDGPLHYDLSQDDDGQVWAKGPDLHQLGHLLAARVGKNSDEEATVSLTKILEGVPEVRREIVMVTGSHHYLAFWLEGGEDKELRQLPFVFLLSTRTWAPREEVFLQPPNGLPHIARWNANCIQCHAVAGQPKESERQGPDGLEVRYESRVAELGISCEACHGPGKAHADSYKNPLSRALARLDEAPQQPGFGNPAELTPAQEVAVCGQCHAYFVPRDPDSWWETGYLGRFLPGDRLDASRMLLLPNPQQLRRAALSRTTKSIFWSDGTIRVGGREVNGLLQSPCFRQAPEQKRIRCTSCHSLHSGSRADQLKPALRQNTNTACVGCHLDTPEHSGHARDSVGARCVNCHMPKTSYALLKAIASHRITSPSHRLTDPPSACVLCHVDRSEAWHHLELARLFPALPQDDLGSAPIEPIGSTSVEEAALPYAVTRALTADAAERAVYAAHLASPETLAAAGPAWPRETLSELTRDPYHAVRRIAESSLLELRELPVAAPRGASQLAKIHELRDTTPVVISE